MVQFVAAGRPAPLVVSPQRLSPSRSSAPGLLANTHNKPLQSLPGRSLGPPPGYQAKRLIPPGQGQPEYLVTLVRHGEWPTVDMREHEELLETTQDPHGRPDSRLPQGSCRRQGGRTHSGPRSASELHGGARSNSPTPRVLPPAGEQASTLAALQSPPRSNKNEALSNRDANDEKCRFDQLAAMFQKSFADKASLPSSRRPSHSPGRTSVPCAIRAGSAPTSAPRARSGSPSSARQRASPTKALASPRVSSPRSPKSPRTKGNNVKSKSPGARKGSDSVICPRPISGTRSPGPPENTAPVNSRSSWPRRTSAPSSPRCNARHNGTTGVPVPGVKGSSPRLSRHSLQPTKSTQAHSPSDRSSFGKPERAETVSIQKGQHRSTPDSSILDESKLILQAPPPSPCTPPQDDTTSEAETSNCIWQEAQQEWPTAGANHDVQRPALREIQPQAVIARSLAKDKENQAQPMKPANTAWQLSPGTQTMQRVLVRTEECRQLEILEESVCTPRREQVRSAFVPSPNGRLASRRLLPLSSSTQSTWSLCNSEDSPSTWSAGFGSSGIVTDLEEGDQMGHPLSRPRLSHGTSKACDTVASKETPPSPSTPFFGKASANDNVDTTPQSQEPCRSVVTDTCARVLYQLRRNTSLIRLTREEETGRRMATVRDS